jgi:hypothetical protein
LQPDGRRLLTFLAYVPGDLYHGLARVRAIRGPTTKGFTMRKLLAISLSVVVGFVLALLVMQPEQVAHGGPGEVCVTRNGDINADAVIDLSDALTVLGHLFLGTPTALPSLCSSPGGGSGLPATGHTKCWEFDGENGIWIEVECGQSSCAGQDGDTAAGCSGAGRFVDNGDGTVTDTCTNLMWQKDTADVSGDGQIDPPGDSLAWCNAVSHCDALEFAGYDDWRLPNIKELQSIVDYGRNDPCIDPVFETLGQYYWSSTTMTETPDNAWGVGFTTGYVGVRLKTGDFEFSFNFVRAVRDAG